MSVNEFSPAALAYLGDAVIELMVRKHLVLSGISDAGKLNERSRSYVCAIAQSEAMEKIMPLLTEEELTFFKWGRNLHTAVPKSASVGQYRRATGMETLFACLYLGGKQERMNSLFNIAFNADKNKEELK